MGRRGAPTPQASISLLPLRTASSSRPRAAARRGRGRAGRAGRRGGQRRAGGPVQLSVATAEQLDSLPGIGPVTAQKILDYRTAHGAFRSVDELDEVPGIGPARVEQLRGLVVP